LAQGLNYGKATGLPAFENEARITCLAHDPWKSNAKETEEYVR
jgi:hypothetical protein